MRKLGLSEWASIAQIMGMLGVIVSLVFVAVSLERNTLVVSGQSADQIYEAARAIDLVLLQDQELLALSRRGLADWDTLTRQEREWYEHWIAMHINNVEQLFARQSAGLVQSETVQEGWYDGFLTELVRRHLNREIWEDIKWWWAEDSQIRSRVEAALSDSDSGR